MFTKKFDNRVYLSVGAVPLTKTLGVPFGAYVLWPSNREAGYAPEQPIAYSHKDHAGDLKIECIY